MPPTEFDAALFDTVRAALMFSFRMLDAEVISGFAYGKTRVSGARVAMTAFEWHGQAALIVHSVTQNFVGFELALVLADYGAGRYRVAGARECAVRMAARSERRALTHDAVLRHFGLSDIPVAQLARRHGISKRTADYALADIRERLGGMSDLLAPRLETLFVRRGICAGL